MSKITFLIGNGFDLACGLRTKYKDTYHDYVNSTPSSPSEEIAQFKKTIQENIPTWADFEMKLIDYARTLKSEKELLTCLRDYDAFLNDYLQGVQQEFWTANSALEKGANAVIKEVGRSLSYFYTGLTENDVRGIRNVILRSTPVNYKFISFNYTDVFDRLVVSAFNCGEVSIFDASCIRSDVQHIHGILGEDVTLGIDNEAQLTDLPYGITSRGKRALIKPVFLQMYDDNRLEEAKKKKKKSDVVCIFGLSLGDSDATWRSQLASWLKANKTNHLIYYKHKNMVKKYHSTAKTQKMDDEEDSKEELISLLFDHSLEKEEKEALLNQIHAPVGVSLFNITEALKKERDNAVWKTEMKKKLETHPI